MPNIIDIFAYPPRSNNPFEQAKRTLIQKLAALKAPIIGSWPEPRDFRDVTAHILEVAAIADEWLKAIGDEVASNSYCKLDKGQFDGRITDAVEGWATGEVSRAEGVCEEEILDEVRS